ncbi:CRISPR-associated endonuclease Cas3'' [Leptolyngbya sp. PCC 6406]|uniref:CRISPR-associated endonuclease Cas3'' n=1 Tax=Leptolyngbya sp. PCC 6406 TaxID=1173264 RepID=UPI0002AC4342|nr:CRISPR-associated endonuclease Cas3'' [Leptolyngbya sp. PCC 6406]
MKYARPGQLLKDHLLGVADKTALRLPPQWKEVGYYAGLWHDLGKILQQWQNYLLDGGRRVPHSPHGAMLARSLTKRPLAVPSLTFVIAGHHGGLRDKQHLEGDDFTERAKDWEAAKDEAVAEIAGFLPVELPEFNFQGRRRKERQELAIRMLFGCLVDADRIDAAGIAPSDSNGASLISTLSTCFNPRHSDGTLAELRREFAADCMAKAALPRGLFRLTGPTGVGKTMASLQFAIAHCQANTDLEGILYVGPLKSVIDQTWKVYCKALNVPVLAHYSDFQPSEEEAADYKLTTERWDKPVICTSGVQFYESLFARSPAKCRKLSHLMRRCILIDEAQTIPLEYARPILDVLRSLVDDWGCSVLLMSATQPSFRNIDKEFDRQCIDIISDAKCEYFFEQTRRVNYKVSFDNWQWPNLIDCIASNKQSLTIVNTTKLSKEGFLSLSDNIDGNWFHLSARMVPAHRQQVLEEILRRLDPSNPQSCHVISTQVVEAGIDLDFPLVLRQMAPLDSIIQASGRCNRENKLPWQNAVVQIFNLDGANYPSSDYRARSNITQEVLKTHDLNSDLLDMIALYYSKCYDALSGDKYEIQSLRRNLKFEQVEEKFKIIEDTHQFSAFVPWGKGMELMDQLLLSESLSESQWRSLQPYTINLPIKWEPLAEKHACGLTIWPLSFYSKDFGASEMLQASVI